MEDPNRAELSRSSIYFTEIFARLFDLETKSASAAPSPPCTYDEMGRRQAVCDTVTFVQPHGADVVVPEEPLIWIAAWLY